MPQGAFLKGIPSLRARDQSLNCERSRALFRYPIVSSSLILLRVEHPPAVIDLTLHATHGSRVNKKISQRM